jgi:hypothetical protein
MREKPTNATIIYLFILLIMYGSSYMFRHYIAIFRESSYCLLRNAQLRSSRYNIVDCYVDARSRQCGRICVRVDQCASAMRSEKMLVFICLRSRD